MREVDARTCDAGALKDPDFQYATGQAQKGFVRTDDEVIAASLINLLAERSQYVERSRASLSLNGAIEVVGNLTSEEIAGLTAVFVISRAILKTSIPQILYVNFNKYTSSLTESMTQESGSIEYLLSHGCVTRNQFPGPDLFSTIRDIYILAFSDGFILSDFEKEFPEIDADTATKILIRLRAPGLGAPVNYTESSVAPESLPTEILVKFNTSHPEIVARDLAALGHPGLQTRVSEFATPRAWAVERVTAELSAAVPDLVPFAQTWLNAGMNSVQLTALGIAVAHSNARRLWADFREPLSTWIR